MHGATNEAWRVAVIGAGPSAFYATEALFKSLPDTVRVDMFDRLPVPYGLVRGGVAPDHQNIKAVVKVYEKIAANPGFRFFGNVKLGRDLQVEDLARHYHQIVYAFGCESDQKLGLPGEDLRGVHAATDFVGWYNGHPDHRHHQFDLANARRVAIVGNGNVAMDVARVLLSDAERLAATDIAEHALTVLRGNQVREVILLGRRGPAQAAFSPKEIQEIAELPDTSVAIRPEEAELDAISAAGLQAAPRSQQRNVKFVQEHVGEGDASASRKLRCRFLVAPVGLTANPPGATDSQGKLCGVRVQRMQLVADADGVARPKPIEQFEDLEVDLLFKAIGYKGLPVAGVPHEPKKGTVPNRDGRVLQQPDGLVVRGQYAVGWCKRGPTGLIGTNSADAKATVEAMLADRTDNVHLQPSQNDIEPALRAKNLTTVAWADWERLDAWELAAGAERGKLRHKLPTIEEMLAVVHSLRTNG